MEDCSAVCGDPNGDGQPATLTQSAKSTVNQTPVKSPAASLSCDSPRSHSYQYSTSLVAALQRRRFRGKWASTHKIADGNSEMGQAGGVRVTNSEGAATWIPLPPIQALVVPSPPTMIDQGSSGNAGPDGSETDRPVSPAAKRAPLYATTTVAVANVDTLSAAIELRDAAVLNFANAETPGGRYLCGARAQEEDLCRLLPQLHPALVDSKAYPLDPGSAVLVPGALAVREVGTYRPCLPQDEVTVITATMPCGTADRRPKGGWLKSPWAEDVSRRIRAVLLAARVSMRPNLVLGAFGCGAFGNPPKYVALLFREQLKSPEFAGAFRTVVFAILDPLGTGNLGPFQRELGSQQAWECTSH
eukprot:m.373139 g.373139  ORF g.373139 m.373139 type:complete len:359 (-) comp16690_c0_seq5:492-1568(-)